MLIPLGTDRAVRRPPLVTPMLVFINVAVYLAQQLSAPDTPRGADPITALLALTPGHSPFWTYLTYAFLHAGFMHVAGNMLFLWVFGRDVEDRFGRVWFALFYLVGAAAAGVGHAVFRGNPVIGASGGVAAVTGAFLVLFPRTHVRLFCFFIIIGVVSIPAGWFIAARIIWDMALEGTNRSGSVATLAHLAGYAFGAAVAALLILTGRLSREPYDLVSLFRQAARRRQFREVEFQRKRAEPAARQAVGAPDAASDALATARAAVSSHIAREDLETACALYRRLLEAHGTESNASILSRRHQYDVANHLFRTGDYQTCVTAYELFLRAYPRDAEAPAIKVLIGRVAARYLNDPVRARRALSEAIEEVHDEQTLALARQELADLG